MAQDFGTSNVWIGSAVKFTAGLLFLGLVFGGMRSCAVAGKVRPASPKYPEQSAREPVATSPGPVPQTPIGAGSGEDSANSAKQLDADPVVPQQANPVPTDNTQPRSEVQTASPQPSVEDEATRVRSLISSSNFYYDSSRNSGEMPGQSMMLRVDATYANARLGDVAQGKILLNGRLISQCAAIPIQVPTGNFWCRTAIFAPGDYQFVVEINHFPAVIHEFNILPPSPQAAPQQFFEGRIPHTSGYNRLPRNDGGRRGRPGY
jgi:hypothetical protein